MSWTEIIVVSLIVIIVFSILFYFLQEKLIFKPEKLPEDFVFQYKNQIVEEYNVQLQNGVVINGLHFKTKNPKGVVYYLKGNSKSIKGWGKFAVDFTLHGWDVLMIDYRGLERAKASVLKKL